MKKDFILFTCLLGLALPATAADAKADKIRTKGKDRPAAAQQVLKRFDGNGDGKIDGAEAAALRKAFDGPNQAALAAFDTTKDGKLDDAETAAIHSDQPAREKESQVER